MMVIFDSKKLQPLAYDASVAVAIKSTGYALEYIGQFSIFHTLLNQSLSALSEALRESITRQPMGSRLSNVQNLLKLVKEIDLSTSAYGRHEDWMDAQASVWTGLSVIYMLLGGHREFEETILLGQEVDGVANYAAEASVMSRDYVLASHISLDYVVKCLNCVNATFKLDSRNYAKGVKRGMFDLVDDIYEDINYFTSSANSHTQPVSKAFYMKAYPRYIYLLTFLAKFLGNITGRIHNSPIRFRVYPKTGLEEILAKII